MGLRPPAWLRNRKVSHKTFLVPPTPLPPHQHFFWTFFVSKKRKRRDHLKKLNCSSWLHGLIRVAEDVSQHLNPAVVQEKKVREEWNENKKEDEKNRRWRKKGTGNRLLFWLPMNGFYCWIKRLLTMAISQIFWFFIWLKWRQGLFIIGDGPIHDAGELFAFYSITWIEPAMNQCLTRLGEWLN